MSKPQRIHLASRCYIRGWAINEQVAVQPEDLGAAPELRNVTSVGWRHAWWGKDRALSDAAERTLQQLENAVTPILREFGNRWPLSQSERGVIAQFMAVHTVRTSAWRAAYEAISLAAINDELAHKRWQADMEKAAVAAAVGDQVRVNTLMRQVPRLASLFMSMHWSLVVFDEPLIASGDQPVVSVPRLPAGPEMPIRAMPSVGFMETAEIRFPIDPFQTLLLTWNPAEHTATPLAGEHRHAADINRTTRQQADQHWFHLPDHRPPLLSPPRLDRHCAPISYEIVSGYTFRVARDSPRRKRADETMRALLVDREIDVMRFVTVSDRAPAA
jgi:hypothetical protein